MSAHSSTSSNAPAPARQQRKRRPALLFAGPLLALALGGSGFWLAQNTLSAGEGSNEPATPPPPTVTVQPAEQRVLVEYAERHGRVAATQSVDLRPEVSGKILSIGFQAGQMVEAGQVLFTIDPRPYAAAVDSAKANVARAESRFANARREADRAQELHAQQAISSEEADLRRSRAAEAEADLMAARAALETARIDLERTEVRSPIDGRVSRAFVTAGNLVSGSPAGATLLTRIVSTGEVHVYVEVDEPTIQRYREAVAAGEILVDESGRIPVELRLGHEAEFSHQGWVESLDNRIDSATGSLTVRLLFPDPKNELLPGSFARVRVPLSARTPQLVVNERSIGTDQSQKFVLVVDEAGTVQYRTVTLGPIHGSDRVIASGLDVGDRVIVAGLQRVRPGVTVEAQLISQTDTVNDVSADSVAVR
jgi:multidrug efflux system membrane fusion protein